jgi:hypothetical protein
VVGGGTGGNLGIVYTDTGAQYGYTRSIGASITTFLDPTCVGYNIQNGYTYGTNPILRCYGNNSASAGTGQFFSTLTVCNNPPTNPVEANIQTYNPAGSNPPTGTVISKAVSTLAITASTINGIQVPQGLGSPTGAVTIWAGTNVSAIPSGWLICDGSLVSKTTFANLYSVIGDSYYNGNLTVVPYPSTDFFLPDLTFAIPQGAVTPTYRCTVVAITTSNVISGFPTPVSSNSYWALDYGGDQTTGTINIGTYFPPGSVPGAPTGIGYRVFTIIDTGVWGNPSIIEVKADDNSAVPHLSTPTVIASAGVYRANGVNPEKFWVPGTFNDFYQGVPPTQLEAPTRNVFRQLDAINIPAHQHLGVPNTTSSAIPGSGYSVGNGGSTAVQTGATSISTIYSPAPYPTKPHVLNMFYIIKT